MTLLSVSLVCVCPEYVSCVCFGLLSPLGVVYNLLQTTSVYIEMTFSFEGASTQELVHMEFLALFYFCAFEITFPYIVQTSLDLKTFCFMFQILGL